LRKSLNVSTDQAAQAGPGIVGQLDASRQVLGAGAVEGSETGNRWWR
jgi:hypothetical protein